MRKNWALFLTTCMIAGTSIFAQGASIVINGKTVASKVAPVQKAGTTLVPLRVISENLGASVKWDGKAKKVIITKGDKTIELKAGSKKALVNGKEAELAGAPEMINNSCMVPIRFIATQFNADVAWNTKTQQVVITAKAADTTTPANTEKPADTTTPADTEKPADTTTPADAEKPADTTTPADTSKTDEKTAETTDSQAEIKDEEAVAAVSKAYTSLVNLLSKGYDQSNPGSVDGYCRLVSDYSTADKITAYIAKDFSKNYADNFIKVLGDRYKEVDGESYFVLGDVGVVPELDKATVKDKAEKDGKTTVTLETTSAGEKVTYKATLVKEDNAWKLDALDLVNEKGETANALI